VVVSGSSRFPIPKLVDVLQQVQRLKTIRSEGILQFTIHLPTFSAGS
jgi:hypothetical protein